MRLLYVGINSGCSGYDVACHNYLKSIDKMEIDVVYRHINLHDKQDNREVQHLIDKDEFGCDTLLIHGLPTSFYYDGRFKKCIGLFAWETDIIPSNWTKSCNMMDEVWVINKSQAEACFGGGVTVPVRIIPHTFDINKYLQKYESKHPIIQGLSKTTNKKQVSDIGGYYINEHRFKFYTIGEFNRRKNYAALIKAFHLEFKPEEPVDLVIKTSKEGFSAQDIMNETIKFCDEMKRGLKLYGNNLNPYKREIIITDRLSENDIYALHQTCDCFISTSYGEAWNQPAFDAMAFGKTPIVTDCTGFRSFINDTNPVGEVYSGTGYLVKCRPEPVFGVLESSPELYSGRENWYSIDMLDLMKTMRLVYNNRIEAKNHLENAARFSYETIGQLIKQALLCETEKRNITSKN